MAEIEGWRAVLCCPQVATRTQIAAERRLPVTPAPDFDFVQKEVVPGAMLSLLLMQMLEFADL
jgi:hypothetical protein